ncbi:MAG TPA: hypothetical protein VHH15_05835 [Actinophytocola sp.]|nr:hypothetical protein [Actinophytocola sp.]
MKTLSGGDGGADRTLRVAWFAHDRTPSVFAALAGTRFVENAVGWSIKRFVRSKRRYRTHSRLTYATRWPRQLTTCAQASSTAKTRLIHLDLTHADMGI